MFTIEELEGYIEPLTIISNLCNPTRHHRHVFEGQDMGRYDVIFSRGVGLGACIIESRFHVDGEIIFNLNLGIMLSNEAGIITIASVESPKTISLQKLYDLIYDWLKNDY